jgi:parvulin-like peptidyl-prolyl isomerase
VKDLFSITKRMLVVSFLGLYLTGCGGTTPSTSNPGPTIQPEQGTPPEVAATVNGQPIAMKAFQRELARFEAGQVSLGWQAADPSAYKQQVLNQLIEQELLRQLAVKQGIVVSDETVDTEINAMIQESGQEYFDAWLSSSYYELPEFREVIRLELMVSQLKAPVIASVPTATEQVRARHILVNTQAEAEQIVARLQAGEDFGALAAEYSFDVTTKDNGGDLGWFPRGGLLVPEAEEAAFSMSPGQPAVVVVSAWGTHIIQTLETDPARQVDPETHDRLIRKAIEQWQSGLRAGADIQQLVPLTS